MNFGLPIAVTAVPDDPALPFEFDDGLGVLDMPANFEKYDVLFIYIYIYINFFYKRVNLLMILQIAIAYNNQ